jgi:hypothetical protein
MPLRNAATSGDATKQSSQTADSKGCDGLLRRDRMKGMPIVLAFQVGTNYIPNGDSMSKPMRDDFDFWAWGVPSENNKLVYNTYSSQEWRITILPG